MPYIEFATTTNYSFLRGASHPKELVTKAHELGHAAIGIADRNSLAGIVRAYAQARELGFRLHVGARLVFTDGTPDILAYPQDRAAYGRLSRLLTVGNRRAEKGDCILTLNDLIEHNEGLNLILIPPRPNIEAASVTLHHLSPITQNRLWLAATLSYHGDDQRHIKRLIAMSHRHNVPLIATGDVLYHAPERRPLQDVLTCIREHTTLDAAGFKLEANAERHLKAPAEIARLYRAIPDAVDETIRFAERLAFKLDDLRYEYPHETQEGFATTQDALIHHAEEGARRRFPDGLAPKVRHALNHELKLIGELNYAPYFLTVFDIVRFARSQGILCQGRGSAANSVVCYCLGVTEVDPTQVDLLFERFVSAERREPPDIDVDFEHERREEVIQYIYRRYGRHRAGLAATVICYRGRSAIRDVGKAFGLSEDTIGALAGTLWGWSTSAPMHDEVKRIGLDPTDRRLAQALALAQELTDFPRHLSQHVGGFVMTRGRLDEVVPISNAAMEDRTVVEWDKDDLNALGILKVDVLALGMLSCIRKALQMLHTHYGLEPHLAMIPKEEPAVYDMICRADTVGVFQIESRAQMSMLPRLKPRKFYDLVIEVAIVRPGPIQGGMVHPYLRRRQGFEQPVYPKPELEAVLKNTLGVPLFQEQAMRIAIVAAKFTPSEADRLRRSMATFRHLGTIKTFEDKFINGMIENGYERDFAARCFEQIKGFGDYGFPESHAASFALLVYFSCWIKCHYPDVFAAALLNSQPMGFYAPAQIVRDAQEHGVEMRAVDINDSDWDNTLEPNVSPSPSRGEALVLSLHPRHAVMAPDIRSTHAMRLGFRQISGFREDDAKLIEQHRNTGYDSIRDLWLRTGLDPSTLERLADADAFRSIGLDRREALWAVRGLRRVGDKDDLPLLAAASAREYEADVALPTMPLGEHVVEDYRHLHLSLKAHPVSFLRDQLQARRVVENATLPTIKDGRIVTVAGLVLVRQRPGTASGVIFMTLEDETGIANIVVWPKMFETFRPQVLGARFACVRGRLQSESNVIHVIADHIEDLTPLLSDLHADTSILEPMSRADEVKRPVPDSGTAPGAKRVNLHKHPRNVRPLQPSREYDAHAATKVHAVMPKGRNFH
ncbi:MAG: error-prone DNA polymerase [Alphaproteobacteria bacterium]|nr:error-prone DNA polymerase [Alphaproteobacteria bacterium]